MNKWWQDAVVYQIYPRSFMDSNGDGIGDLRGIISKLDYLKDLGVDVLWLSPVYQSPNADNGYDISDYRAIDPVFGTMEDMELLIEEAKQRNIRIIMDLVINHTSDEHEWFQNSRAGIEPYRDYYYWASGDSESPPNNWTGFFGGRTWTKDPESGDWYLHLFTPKQPDLNYHNPAVIEEIQDILRFWLEKGIAGFRCDVINIIFKDSLQDGKRKFILTGSEHYLSRPGSHDVLHQLHQNVLSNYECFTVGETVFITPEIAQEYCEKRAELDMVFSFEHMEADQLVVKWFKRKFKPVRFFKAISKWQKGLSWNALYLENHDQPRAVSRFGDDRRNHELSAKMLALFLLSLRGTPFIYQGQELGMTNFDYKNMTNIRDVESHNIYALAQSLHFPKSVIWNMIKKTSRDNARTPMQWDSSEFAGFSAVKPWIKVNQNHSGINAEDQINTKSSILTFYRRMIRLRATSAVLREGIYREISINGDVFCFERVLKNEKYTVIVNFGPGTHRIDRRGEVVISNYNKTFFEGHLMPWEGVVLK